MPTQRFEGEAEKLEVYRHFRFSKFQDIDDFYQCFFEKYKSSELFSAKAEAMLRSEQRRQYLREFAFYTENDRIFRYIRDKLITEQQYHNLMTDMMIKYHYDQEENEQNLYMKEQELEILHTAGNIIGLHSHTHFTSLADVGYKRQKLEYETNKRILQEIVGGEIDVVSYPCNSYNDETLKIMRELEVKIGFRANMEDGYSSLLELPREDHINIIQKLRDENCGICE